MKWYQYTQNNSGGQMDVNERVSHYVLVQAPTASQADSIAEAIVGIYFNGVEDGMDCECCGDRWYPNSGNQYGDKVPLVYGKPPADERLVRIYPFGSFKSVSINDLNKLPKPMVIEPS